MNYRLIKLRYDTHKITAQRVWQYADDGVITEEQAAMICGAKP